MASEPPPPPRTSIPKLAIVDPFEGITRLRAPSGLGEVAAKLDRDLRDTDPDEITPAERPFEIRVEQRLDKLEEHARKHDADLELIKKSSRDAAQHVLEMHAMVKAMSDRMKWFELENKWLPRVVLTVNLLIALWALSRTYR